MQRFFVLSILIFSFFQVKATTHPSDSINRETEINTIISLTEKYICNPNWLETEGWKNFVAKIQSEEAKQMSAAEFKRFFNIIAREELPFSHFQLHLVDKGNKSMENTAPHFELEEIDKKTVRLIVRSFVADPNGMIKMVEEIKKKGYENLIIDLRDNGGGTLDGAVVISYFLTNQTIDAGVYMTRGWFKNNKDYPTQEQIAELPVLKDLSLKGFQQIASKSPAFRMLIPAHNNPVFQGKVYVLTNSNTASACEPFVDLLKKKKLATIVGLKTAGMMLSGQAFPVSEELNLFLPIADYLNAEGNRLDMVGVEPDVKKPHEQSLGYVLEEIKK